MHWFCGILGAVLAAIWLDRLRDAAFGMRRIPQLTQPQWDRWPQGRPRATLIVPARNEEEHVEAAVR